MEEAKRVAEKRTKMNWLGNVADARSTPAQAPMKSISWSGEGHCGPDPPNTQTKVLGHSLVRLIHTSRFAHAFACSALLALLTRSAALTSLAHFAHSLACGTVNYWMAIYSVYFYILAHSEVAYHHGIYRILPNLSPGASFNLKLNNINLTPYLMPPSN